MRSTWPDPNPAGRFYNHITEASCYCCSLHCPKTHNWIEEFMVFPLFFTAPPTTPAPTIVFKRAICPARATSSVAPPQHASMVTGSKVGDCWTKSVIFKLTGKHPTWTQTKPISHSNSSYHFLFSLPPHLFQKHPCLQPACQFLCGLWLVWRSVQGEHEQLQKFSVK